MNFYSFHVGDYAAHTKHLTPIEDLAYRRMLDLYYSSEKPLPCEPEKVARLIGLRDHMQEVSDVLSDFFVKSEDGHKSKRCDDEIAAYRAKAERAKAANTARWKGEKSDPDLKSDADQLPTKNQEPRTNNHEPEEENTDVAQSAPAEAVLAVFEFWKTVMKSPRSLLDAKRSRLIKAALKTGYTVDDLCDAITGCAKSDFHMGKNDRGTKFNGLDLILRNAEKIDQFIVIGRSPLVPSRPPKVYHDISEMDYTKGVDANGRF